MQADDIDVSIGIDVGTTEHWAAALTKAGQRLHDKPSPNDETKLRDLWLYEVMTHNN